MLADYAVRVEQSGGRRFPELPHPYRNDFQRDRDRIIHSRAFRRLENKTQVFTHRFSDHFRNRLTHTIEVTQVSRTIAQQLGLNSDLVEALALAHDIGHPPFGHAGEKALDGAMRAHGLSFDHNLHALRIVEDFEIRYVAFRGLNLTFEVREGIVKHSRDYNLIEHPELQQYMLGMMPPLEAQLIDFTDEIGYNTADLDDGYEAHILTVEQVRAGVPVFNTFYEKVEAQSPDSPEKLKFNEALKLVFDRFVTDLINNTARRVTEAKVRTLQDIRAYPHRLAGFGDEVDAERAQTKSFLYDHLYFSSELLPDKQEAERIVGEMFEHYLAYPDHLPLSHQEKTKDESLPRIVCDYIAGMTDNFILEQHKKLGN